MKINSIKYYLLDALKNLKRNMTISMASVATISATLFILGIFLLLMINMNVGISNVQSKIEIKVFLKDEISLSEQKNIGQALININGIKKVVFQDKDEALKSFTEQLPEKDKSLLSGYNSSNNPMPNSYILTLTNPEMDQEVTDKLKTIDGIESIGNDKEFIKKIISISNTLKWVGAILFVMLVGVSMFLMGNTIKLTIFSRRREIGIMKFVGATDWFIRWPFIIEGTIIGIIGAVLSNLTLYYIYKLTFVKVTENILLVHLVNPQYIIFNMLWVFIFVGASIGSLGSVLSLKKFLVI